MATAIYSDFYPGVQSCAIKPAVSRYPADGTLLVVNPLPKGVMSATSAKSSVATIVSRSSQLRFDPVDSAIIALRIHRNGRVTFGLYSYNDTTRAYNTFAPVTAAAMGTNTSTGSGSSCGAGGEALPIRSDLSRFEKPINFILDWCGHLYMCYDCDWAISGAELEAAID